MRVPTMAEVIMREIEKRVMDGFYRPGQKLNVDELARDLSVSKTPVREALGRLARQGIVESQPRIGWRVSLLSQEEFLQFQEVKHLIRSYLARQIPSFVNRINFEKIEAMNSNMHHFTKTRQFDRLLEENDKFHMEIFSVYPNKVLLEYLEEVSSAIRLQRIFMLEQKHLDENSPLISEAAQEHEEIIEALKRGNALEIISSFEKHQMTIRESSLPSEEQ
ncbi:MAG: GntR family transcriptional regulator [Synergistales bacterium]|nr:GntR family transcriptional regulator [Synergistales bacterium]